MVRQKLNSCAGTSTHASSASPLAAPSRLTAVVGLALPDLLGFVGSFISSCIDWVLSALLPHQICCLCLLLPSLHCYILAHLHALQHLRVTRQSHVSVKQLLMPSIVRSAGMLPAHA